ncbi:uncharacterized protein LOC108908826 [Anoplophora glabripennis]|uniref:uncharacterized protein LOC108908826 n=1 Tax=Anoplophora glabripennis TaxID=217634 RepID=UPI00087583F1|nr:uncharacterized protein LOC108908826 [Anoplophora glabripennis]
MQQQSYKYSSDHIQNKRKRLLRTYKSIKDHHGHTGTNRKNWQYFDLMDKLMHNNPAVIPPVIVSNGILEKTTSEGIKITETNQLEQSDTSEAERESLGQSSPTPPPKRKCTTDNVTALLKTVVAQSQKQHEEEMKERVKFNNLLEKLVNHVTGEK